MVRMSFERLRRHRRLRVAGSSHYKNALRWQAACSGDGDLALLLCLLRLTYGDPALREANGAVSLTEDLLSDLLGHGTAKAYQRVDSPAIEGADAAATEVTAERSPSYTELELIVPGLQSQARHMMTLR